MKQSYLLPTLKLPPPFHCWIPISSLPLRLPKSSAPFRFYKFIPLHWYFFDYAMSHRYCISTSVTGGFQTACCLLVMWFLLHLLLASLYSPCFLSLQSPASSLAFVTILISSKSLPLNINSFLFFHNLRNNQGTKPACISFLGYSFPGSVHEIYLSTTILSSKSDHLLYLSKRKKTEKGRKKIRPERRLLTDEQSITAK